MSVQRLMRHPDGLWYHGLAVTYALTAYVLGLVMLFPAAWWLNAAGVLLLGHGMIIAAYLVHEAGHNTIFRKNRHNQWLGRCMNWLCGGAYNKFEDIRYKHFRHHVENDDIVWFDYEQFFKDHPLVYRITAALEWLHIPAHELIMHGLMMINSFVIPERREQRAYNVTVIVIRGALFATLIWFSPKAAVLYCVAYLLMLIVLRFVDSLQHDYEYNVALFTRERSPHRGDKDWEQEHTFSVPLSLKYSWLNWLTLNFGYHNAHHAKPIEPWYRLPKVHQELFGDDPNAVIPLWQQLKIYHQGRVKRLVKWDDDVPEAPKPQGVEFLRASQRGEGWGGNAASFLTAH